MSEAILVIDGQKDFMDLPTRGSLGVDGAYQDMLNLAKYIKNNIHVIDAIFFTLDTHAKEDIAHAMWWVNENGEPPEPFTIITYEDVLNGKWKAAKKEHQEYSLEYVKQLKENGKYKLCIWPYHCIKGTVGHEIVDVLKEALMEWEQKTGKKVTYIYKGENPYTEHYSGLKAEVVLSDDPKTDIQIDLIKEMDKFSKIKVAGEARSHCVASTTRDLVAYVNPKKVTLLTDTMSDVTGFSDLGETFVQDMIELGVNVETTEDKLQSKLKM
jgi:nicotinamidase/pyrazinamidase